MIALKTILNEIDPDAFDTATKIPKGDKRRFIVKPNQELRKKLDSKWDKLDNKLKARSSGFTPPEVPFQSSNLVSNYNSLYTKIYDKEKFINE